MKDKQIKTLRNKVKNGGSLAPMLIVLGVLVCSLAYFGGWFESGHDEPMQLDFWRGGVVVSGTPSVGTPFTISFGVNPIETVPDANMRIFIPDGMALVSGEDIKMGVNIPANSTYTQTITVKTTRSGAYEISGRIESATWSSFNRSYWKFIESTATGGDTDTPIPEPPLVIIPTPNPTLNTYTRYWYDDTTKSTGCQVATRIEGTAYAYQGLHEFDTMAECENVRINGTNGIIDDRNLIEKSVDLILDVFRGIFWFLRDLFK